MCRTDKRNPKGLPDDVPARGPQKVIAFWGEGEVVERAENSTVQVELELSYYELRRARGDVCSQHKATKQKIRSLCESFIIVYKTFLTLLYALCAILTSPD